MRRVLWVVEALMEGDGGLESEWWVVLENKPGPLVRLWGCCGHPVWGMGWYGTLVWVFNGRSHTEPLYGWRALSPPRALMEGNVGLGGG